MMRQRGISFFQDAWHWIGGVRFDVIFDVGANVGQSAHVFAEMVPQASIWCFEPVERAFKELKRNVAYFPNVKPYRLAMSATGGWADMHVAEETSLSSISVNAPGSVVEVVPMVTLDEFCGASGIERIDFLKIDTEGHDIDVLQGAFKMLAGRVNFVQVETSFYEGNKRFIELDRFVDFLGFGYEIFGIYDQMAHPTGRPSIAYFNAVFVNSTLLKEPPWR